MLYKKNQQPKLDDELFKNPTCEYRGTPFWAWNCKLDAEEMKRQIEIFKKMGLGGFHMHVRTGLDTEYLSDEYMDVVKACVEKAKKEKMLAWLYDEDRWPSGAAGGIVTKDEKYRSRYLEVSPERIDNAKLLCCYDVILDSDGFLARYSRIDENTEAEGTKWYAYLKLDKPSSWHNGQTYVDTLNKKAIERFIEVTHEAYKKELYDDFGEAVPAIFTDEPQFYRKGVFENSSDKKPVKLPWTDDIPETYKAQYGTDVLDTIPELFWELPGGRISKARYLYHDHIAERFAASFADTCGEWCRKNKLALTGHMMEEPTLKSQTAALGEAMRSYRGFDLPGIDMLCAWFEFTTAKQAQSASHQFGREGVLSELYGVTGWDYDFRGYKLHGDWQAALGVTVRVPHLSWASMQGAAKRDYPASIHYQSPWYEKFSVVEDHFGRVNSAMTRGKPMVKVGVIHPVESFWLHWGPNDKTELERSSADKRFQDMTDWLLKGSVDFDFICESLLPELCTAGGAPLEVGCMKYDTIVVPGCETLRSTTLERLEKFRQAGGTLIFMGDAPKYEDAEASDRGERLYKESKIISYDRAALLTALEKDRLVTLRNSNGALTDDLIYQLRRDNTCNWLFIAHCAEPYNKDVARSSNINIRVRGEYTPMLYDTLTGDISPMKCYYVNGDTVIPRTVYGYDSILIRLDDGRGDILTQDEKHQFTKQIKLPDMVAYTLSEPNVLLLDMAQTSVDGAPFIERDELLRADNIWREKLGLPKRDGNCVQPWVIAKEEPKSRITLKYIIESDINISSAKLALEDAENAAIMFNGKAVENTVTGWYTDKSIKTVNLPTISEGYNELLITIPFGLRTNTEWCYILGDFGVRLEGKHAVLTAKPHKIAFSNVVYQGFPFYAGNITYHMDIECDDGEIRVCTPHFRGGLTCASIDGKEIGNMAYMPYATVAEVSKGIHTLDITAYGHRYNAFGAVHNANSKERWHGPGAWESTGTSWSYEYVLSALGLLSSPIVFQ